MALIEIGNRKIGDGYPPLVIAEIGINHEGSLKIAKEMVDAAYKAGAEVIKHQTHIVDDEMSHKSKMVKPGNSDSSIYDIMSRCALSEEEEIELKEYIESKGMIFLSTPFSRAAADRLEKMGVVAYKIGSGEMNNFPLLEHIASFGKPMIVSTGMNELSTVKKAVKCIEKYQLDYALLHTTNLYPTPPNLVRLGALQEMMREFPNCVIGLSDHTVNNNACLAAVALGANILERHFTDTIKRTGPDIVCSMTPEKMKELIAGANEISQMRGGKKEAAEEEQVTMDFAFSTIVTIDNVKKGDIFTEKNIWVKRPGIGGIKAEDFQSVLGKKATRNISIDEQLNWEDVYLEEEITR
ncbi:N-acetylneuraminate synthase family protein [Gracilibacillus sp. S3-1-1]|uniref:N-acetylneuraminate synthase family protein n=1 Tax=Gracilibacillus pellucidus TaxID=3095368 RepID=A0ACC6M0Y8_9BACI|nr:N-acetylneuraminate synthase family protein [Gracilibacillus sp. S3-1-1]MDX8044608.1 N-acetylneuraminate synthase family protein [Gracilibacillus sp. S3-1-1]